LDLHPTTALLLHVNYYRTSFAICKGGKEKNLQFIFCALAENLLQPAGRNLALHAEFNI